MTVTEYRAVSQPNLPPTPAPRLKIAAESRPADPPAPTPDQPDAGRYLAVRRQTERICEPLEVEDYVVQTIPDVSPAKWHLAHTSWFFERFLLVPHLPEYEEKHPLYNYLFNSYYVTVGERHCRVARGQVTRPTVAEVYDYRAHVDAGMARLLATADDATRAAFAEAFEVGLNHEQQHQELIVTDVKHVYACNPIYPVYRDRPEAAPREVGPTTFTTFAEGLREVGHAGDGFAYDNESPRHKHYLRGFALADRLVTNGEFIRFIDDGGYKRPELWLSEGAACIAKNGWDAPFYWERTPDGWHHYTLNGYRRVDPAAPMCHASYFEADAFARWADTSGLCPGARLPTEFEWEAACVESHADPADGTFVDDAAFHPTGGTSLFGDVWQWTRSQYEPYPGYRPPAGALGEYNGKFMCNQFVLRGGSVATSRDHVRATYRNFFPPDARWQFSGLRLARDD